VQVVVGKAHTVMAEGGIARPWQNVDQADDWRMHFPTQCARQVFKTIGGWPRYCSEAPDRVHELEQWGALFDRTSDA